MIVTFQTKVDEIGVCGICLEDCCEYISCCGSPLHQACIDKWAQESNRCPYCNRRIHNGPDRRYLNHNEDDLIELHPDHTIPASVLFESIRQFLIDRISLYQETLNTVEYNLTTETENHFPINNPLRLPIITNDIDLDHLTFTFDFDYDDNTIHMSVDGNQGVLQMEYPLRRNMTRLDIKLEINNHLLVIISLMVFLIGLIVAILY